MSKTIADVFTTMSLLDNEADFTSGGSDESRGIVAIQTSLRYLYTIAAGMKDVLSTPGVGAPPATVKTTAGAEYTIKPDNLLRVDAIWAIDLSTKLPKYMLTPIFETGSHMPVVPWPYSWTNILTNGQPWQYYSDEAFFYWRPVPDAIYEQRVYGLWMPNLLDPVDRTSPVDLPSRAWTILQTPLAAFALKYLQLAVDDPTDQIDQLAKETFSPALKTLQHRGDYSRARPRIYSTNHTT